MCCCCLDYEACAAAAFVHVQHPGDKPVWRQVLRLHLGHKNSQVAQQAAAALAE